MKRRSFIIATTTGFASLFLPAKSLLAYFSRTKIKTPSDYLSEYFTGYIEGIGYVTRSHPPGVWACCKCDSVNKTKHHHLYHKSHWKLEPTTICQTCGDFCIIEECENCPPPRPMGCGYCTAICKSCRLRHEGRRSQLKIMTEPRRILDLSQTFYDHLGRSRGSDAGNGKRVQWEDRFEQPQHLKLYNMMDVIRTSDGVMIKCR